MTIFFLLYFRLIIDHKVIGDGPKFGAEYKGMAIFGKVKNAVNKSTLVERCKLSNFQMIISSEGLRSGGTENLLKMK